MTTTIITRAASREGGDGWVDGWMMQQGKETPPMLLLVRTSEPAAMYLPNLPNTPDQTEEGSSGKGHGKKGRGTART